MEFRVLGRLVVRAEDREVPLGGPLRRAVLAALLLEPNTMVPIDRLVRIMYGEQPPETAPEQVRQAVYHLRKALPTAQGGHRIVTDKPGYRLRLAPDDVLDLDRFDAGVARARKARTEGDLDIAAKEFRAALAWWRGDTLADLAELPISSLTVPVDQRRLTVLDERIEVDLALGRHTDLVPELSDLVVRYPLHDRMWSQLVRSLYRSGRRTDALDAFQRARTVMVEEQGLDPAPELAGLYQRIIDDDPSLEPTRLPLGERPPIAPRPCPYRALEPYGRDDRDLFFGRAAQVAKLVSHAGGTEPITLVGPSGSGKSSLLLAGVLPALSGCAPVVLRPSDGGDAYTALAAALCSVLAPADPPDLAETAELLRTEGLDPTLQRVLAHTAADRLVVVLDQAEELLVQDDDLVERFVRALYEPAAAVRVTVLATLRADLLGPVLERPALAATLGRTVEPLGAMGPAQLREAITAPLAGLPGTGFQDGLVDRIVADVGGEPGGLALLGLTLTLLWDEQVDGMLTHQAYDDLGRVGGALADHAETEWRRHDLAADEATARRLFGDLVRVGDGDTATRRVVARDELDDPTWQLAERLAATRLLVVARDAAERQTVELAHEALIDHWPRLRSWIEGDVEFHRWRETLRSDLARWEQADRDPALLVRGMSLRESRRWHTERPDGLAPNEIEFIRRSERHARSTGHRSRVLRAALAVVVVLALVLAGVFAQQRSEAARAAVLAGSRDLAARSNELSQRDPAYAALLAVAASDMSPTDEASAALFARYRDVVGLRGLRSGPTAIFRALASADGRTMAAADIGGGITVWRETAGAPLRTVRVQAPNVNAADLTLDGSAVWFVEDEQVVRLDLTSGERRVLTRLGPTNDVHLAVSADGTRLLVWDGPVGGPGRVREWDSATGREVASAPTSGFVLGVYPGPPGVAVLEEMAVEGTDRVLERVDLASGAASQLITAKSVQVARDGSTAVACSTPDDAATFTSIPLDGRPAAPTPIGPDPQGLCQFTLDPAGTVLARRVFDAVAIVDLASGRTTRRFGTPYLDEGRAQLAGLRIIDGAPQLILRDETRVALGDTTVPESARPHLTGTRLLRDGSGVSGVAEDGQTLVVVPVRTGGPAASAPRPAPFRRPGAGDLVGGLEQPLIADRVADGRIAVHRLPGLEPLAVITLPSPELHAMFFDDAGRLITWIGGELYWWDVTTGAQLRRLDALGLGLIERGKFVLFEALRDPDRIAVFVSGRSDVSIVDSRTGQVADTLPVGPAVAGVTFQGAHMMVYRDDHSVEIWNAETRQREFGPLPKGSAYDRRVGFLEAPGRFYVADSSSNFGTEFRIFDTGRSDPVSGINLGSPNPIDATSADGSTVAYAGFSGSERTYSGAIRLDPSVWRAQLCGALGGRDFTDDERAALPATPDGPTCR